MKKTFLLIFVLLFFASCGKSNSDLQNQDDSSFVSIKPDELDDDSSTGVPYEAATFDTHLDFDNFSADQEDKVLKAAELIRQVVASQEFKDAIINFTYNGQNAFVDNGGLTNTQIYYKFLQGAEKLSPSKNNAMDAELELYYENSTTIGYTKSSTRRIWMNTKYFNYYTAAQVAGNLTHEWMHKLGFIHDANSTPSRPYSVPYAVGYIMERLTKKYL